MNPRAAYQPKHAHERTTAMRAGRLALSLVLLLVTATTPAIAQDSVSTDQEEPAAESASSEDALLLDDVVVTAQKREQSIQDVPVSITAFDAEQLEATKLRDLRDLTIGIPNVGFDEIGTSRGTANFSIRGLGVNGSVPSIDPTVGVIVDGIYMGTNSVMLYDAFDLESIEVLRGPQGVLFGRNVVGGAVLINTKAPTDQFEATLRNTVEGGGKAPNFFTSATLNAPLTDTLATRFTVYSNQDQGWFKNKRDGRAFGAQDTLMLRPVVRWRPTDTLDLTLRYEYQNLDADGAASQNTAVYDRRDHDFFVDEDGYLDAEVHFFNTRLDWDVAFGNGTLTDIFGWRTTHSDALSDLDGLPTNRQADFALSQFNLGTQQESEQFSNELRYTGRFFNRLHLTTGVYYFTNDLDYHEWREFEGRAPGATRNEFGGGYYDVDTLGLFLNMDYDLTDWLTVTGGLRYTDEEKEADVSYMQRNSTTDVTAPGCNMVRGPACPSHFQDDKSWNSLSPKIGLTLHPTDGILVYWHWTRGFRSGNYNVRITREGTDPGPTDQEQADNFELGFKSTLGTRVRLNGAVFLNMIQDLQRVVLTGGAEGVVQNFLNTADVDIYGVELDGSFALLDNLVLHGAMGYLDSNLTAVRYDLNGDGAVDDKDEDLDLIRAPTWTYSFGLQHSLSIGNRHRLESRLNYAYRDKEYHSDNNVGFHRQLKKLDAGIDLHVNNGQWVVGLYGKNLLHAVPHGIHFVNPGFGSFSPLMKGRTFGLELTYNFTGV